MDTSLNARPLPWRRAALFLAPILVLLAVITALNFFKSSFSERSLGSGYLFRLMHGEEIPVRIDGKNQADLFDTIFVRYERNGWFAVEGIIDNDGSVPVTIEKVYRGVQGGTFGLREVRFGQALEVDERRQAWKRYPAFEPFTLQPGENRVFAAFFDFKDSACRIRGIGGGTFGMDSFDVGYEADGRQGRTPVEYMFEVNTVNPTRAECASRAQSGHGPRSR